MTREKQPIKIRKAEPGDVRTLAQLFLDCRRATFDWEDPSKFQLQDFEKQTVGEVVFVAVGEKGRILGFISVWAEETPPFIHHLFISPQHQNNGVGQLLIESLTSWLPLPYHLKCLVKNIKALSFYRKKGWKEVGRGLTEEGEYLLLELSPPSR